MKISICRYYVMYNLFNFLKRVIIFILNDSYPTSCDTPLLTAWIHTMKNISCHLLASIRISQAVCTFFWLFLSFYLVSLVPLPSIIAFSNGNLHKSWRSTFKNRNHLSTFRTLWMIPQFCIGVEKLVFTFGNCTITDDSYL